MCNGAYADWHWVCVCCCVDGCVMHKNCSCLYIDLCDTDVPLAQKPLSEL